MTNTQPIYHYHKNGTEPPILEHNPWILVFGSNLAGRHGAGAAKLAVNHYGARHGVGFGQEGRSFAWPTKDAQIQTLPLTKIQYYADLMRTYMHHRLRDAHQRYWFTAVGTGLAGYEHRDIAPMVIGLGAGIPDTEHFKLAEHVSFPEEWQRIIEPHLPSIQSADLKSAVDREQRHW